MDMSLAEQILPQSEETSVWMQDRHPVVGGEMLCFDYNTINGVCHAYGGTVSFRQDTVYERSDLIAIVMKETQIKCKTRDGNPCAITIKMTNPTNNTYFYMLDHSMIHGNAIYFESPGTRLTIDATSEIETNGRSTN